MATPLRSISNAAIQRAIDADPNSQRCLIENCSKTQGVQLTHVFDRGALAQPRIVGALEWNWGMVRGTLNLDSRQNIFFVGASLKELYKTRKWALLPEKDVFLQYFQGKRMFPRTRQAFPNLEGDTFKYSFIPLQNMDDIYITRKCTNDANVTVHHCPYDELPTITSHVHPRYVILHLGYILHHYLDAPSKNLLFKDYPWLCELPYLIRLWTQTPEGASGEPSYVPRGAPRKFRSSVPQSDNSLHTLPRRIQVSRQNRTRSKYQAVIYESSSESSSNNTGLETSVTTRQSNETTSSEEGSRVLERTATNRICELYVQRKGRQQDLRSSHWTAGRISSWASTACSSPTTAP